jgi:hypothetical protein
MFALRSLSTIHKGENPMKKTLAVAIAATLVSGLSMTAPAQTPKEPTSKTTVTKTKAGEKPGALIVDEMSVTAVVKTVDHAKRTVTLLLPDKKEKTFTVGKEAVNFPQVKVGDEVKASYIESVAVFVNKPGEKPAAGEATTVALAPKGAKPGALVANTQKITAKVTALDHKTRVVTLTGPEGNSLTFTVGPDVKRLDEIKVGDTISLSYTEALMVDVVATGKSAPKKETPKK